VGQAVRFELYGVLPGRSHVLDGPLSGVPAHDPEHRRPYERREAPRFRRVHAVASPKSQRGAVLHNVQAPLGPLSEVRGERDGLSGGRWGRIAGVSETVGTRRMRTGGFRSVQHVTYRGVVQEDEAVPLRHVVARRHVQHVKERPGLQAPHGRCVRGRHNIAETRQ
jgi:hypothetical protein